MVEPYVVDRLIVRGWPETALNTVACNNHLNPFVLAGIYLIESEFRPFWYRTIEWCYLVGLLVAGCAGIQIPNLTVGRFQLQLSVICRVHQIPVAESRGRVRLTRKAITRLIQVLGEDPFLWDTAARYIGILWHETTGDFESRLRALGHMYNGDDEYGIYLQAIVLRLIHGTSGGSSNAC